MPCVLARTEKINRRSIIASLAAALILALATLLAPAPSKDWTKLFDGKTLNGWETSGKARWVVEDGAIIGRQGEGGAAGDLFTTELYDSFEAEAEWTMHWPGNSGLWFKYQGPGTGCQADILDEPAEPGILSGSVYCMGKQFIAENRDPSSVHKSGWNLLRLRVQNDRVQVWMNGKLVAAATADVFPGPGKLGFQVHPGKQFEAMEIRIRNIRIRRLQ
jgi:hypothetical protein